MADFLQSLNVWYDILDGDIWFPPRVWPRGMERYWRCSNLGYNHRVYIATFAYLNGLDITHLIDALYAVNWMMDMNKAIKIIELYHYWNSVEYGLDRRSRYFTYCFHHNRICDLNHNLYRLRNNESAEENSAGGRRGTGGTRGGHRRVPAYHC